MARAMSHSTAAVQVGPGRLEMQRLPIPEIGPDAGLLRVERAALCGTDVLQFDGSLDFVRYPTIPGHEPVGVIEQIGDRAAAVWGVARGDRVVVQSRIPCLRCRMCRAGQFNVCPERISIGTTPTTLAPGLWGAFSEYLYLHPNTNLYKVPSEVPPDEAAMFNVLAGPIAWAQAGGVRLGDTVVVLGCGQRGLASVIAARAMGAGTIIVSGLTRDEHKLRLARELGAEHTIDVEREDLVARVREITAGDWADVVIEVVPYETETVVDAVEIVRPLGTIVLAGHKGDRPVRGLVTDKITLKAIRLQGVTSKLADAYRQAVRLIASGRYPLGKLHTHTFALSQAAEAIKTLAGRVPGEEAVCVTLSPGA